jgi:predicted RNA-binding Zn ribbon-like protein
VRSRAQPSREDLEMKRRRRQRMQPCPRGGAEPPRPISTFLEHAVFGTLEFSTLLDALNDPRHPDGARARAVVDRLIAQGLTQGTINTFNRVFGDEMMPLRLVWDKHDGRVFVHPYMSPGNVPRAVWLLLRSAQPTRLRRCPACQTYFFDLTRNASQRYCTRRCTSRTTSRAYRARRNTESRARPLA